MKNVSIKNSDAWLYIRFLTCWLLLGSGWGNIGERSKLAKEKELLADSLQHFQSKVIDKDSELSYLQGWLQ